MNSSTFVLSTFRSRTRAQFSPLRRRIGARVGGSTSVVGALDLTAVANALTPLTPQLSERWWNPHLVDRLETPLSRIRE